MKTTNDLKLLIEENKSRINALKSEILELYKVKPYTDRVAKQVKDKYKKIEKANAEIAELRQSIVYLESTPPHGIEESYVKILAQLNAIDREVAQWEDKEIKKEIRDKRSYSKVKAQFKRLQFLMS